MKENGRSFVDLGSKLPFWHFDQDFMVYADGSLGAGFKLSGIDISTASESLVNELSMQLENLINTAEAGLRFQIFYKLSSHVKPIIDAHAELTCGSADEYGAVSEARLKFLRTNAAQGGYFNPEIYFFIRSVPHGYRKQRFWEKDSDFKKITAKEYGDHKSKFERSLRQLQSSLSHARLNPKRLSAQAWFELLYEYFNLTRSEKLECPRLRDGSNGQAFYEPLSQQFTLTDVEVYRNHIRIGDHFIRLVTLKTLPEGQSYASMVEPFLKLPFYFWVSQTITIHDQKKEVEKLQLQRRLAHSMASGATNVSDLESESKLSHIEELLGELLEGSEKIVSADFSVVIWAQNLEELEEKTDEVLKAFRGLNQSEGVAETLPCFDGFIQAMPGACQMFRAKKVKTSNAAHLMPVYSSWRGNKRPVCVLPNRDGVLVSIDPMAPELPAWNGMIFGGTGSGKSFTLIQLILMFYGQRPRPKVVWIDNGASSKRAIEVLDGEFIDLNISSDIRLNAFDLGPGETKPSPSKVKLILAILETILKDEEKPGLPKREKALLEEAIFRCYEHVKDRTPQLGDLKAILGEHPVSTMKAYSEILYSWTGDTAYGRLLDAPSNITLKKNLTTIEMKGLDSFPELQNVFLLLFTEFIRTEASRDITQPFILIIDEGWKLFQTPSGLAFSLEAYRTFRKYHAGIWTISQNYRDFLFSEEISAAILPNTTSIFVLKQRGIDWDDFKKTMGLNETELEAVKSLRVVKGEYTEVFYMQDEGRAVLQITPDPLSYWICTSDPKDKAEIARMTQENPDLTPIQVLQKIVSQVALDQPIKEAA
jgi:conjugal transfer ATP-binding protein TraC